MLVVKPSIYFARQTDFNNSHPFLKSFHRKNINTVVDHSLVKESSNALSDEWPKKSKYRQNKKPCYYFSNCLLFQAKKPKKRKRQIYERNQSSGWLEKIMPKKYYIQQQNQLFQKPIKIQYSQGETKKKLQRSNYQNKLSCNGYKISSELRQWRQSIKKLNEPKRNKEERLTQPIQNDQTRKQFQNKQFLNEIEINLSPWINQYSQ